jgi:hypothetical protein
VTASVRQAIRIVTVLLAAQFLVSSVLNLGVEVPLGFAELSFSTPMASTAEFEVVIGLVLLIAAVFSRLYSYAGAHILASVGILEGLLSSDVQGLARALHEAMVPLAVVAWTLMAIDARSVYKSRANESEGKTSEELLTAMQFFVGGLVTLGGAAYAKGATYPFGTALGLVHLAVGLAGLFGGYAFLRRRAWSRRFLVGINGVTIVYSAFSEGLAQVYSLLPPGVNDSLIGTIVAIVVSGAIIYVLLSRGSPEKAGDGDMTSSGARPSEQGLTG